MFLFLEGGYAANVYADTTISLSNEAIGQDSEQNSRTNHNNQSRQRLSLDEDDIYQERAFPSKSTTSAVNCGSDKECLRNIPIIGGGQDMTPKLFQTVQQGETLIFACIHNALATNLLLCVNI